MRWHTSAGPVFIATLLGASMRAEGIRSCSSGAHGADPCHVPSPGGLLVFRQRFEPDVGSDQGSWGIDGLEVLDCSSQKPIEESSSKPSSPSYDHEHISSFTHRSTLFGGEEGVLKAESEWAQSEVGEGVEEVQERTWMTAGRWITTLAPSCTPKSPKGEEVAAFFHGLSLLHGRFPTAKLLADADITPSADTSYSLNELVQALSFDEYKPVITCDNTTLFSVLWPLNVLGTYQSGDFLPSHDYSRKSNCPADGIIYTPSTTMPTPTPTHTWDPLTRPTPRPITLSHDESKLYPYGDNADENAQKKLGLFADYGGARGDQKEAEAEGRKYLRDEL